MPLLHRYQAKDTPDSELDRGEFIFEYQQVLKKILSTRVLFICDSNQIRSVRVYADQNLIGLKINLI